MDKQTHKREAEKQLLGLYRRVDDLWLFSRALIFHVAALFGVWISTAGGLQSKQGLGGIAVVSFGVGLAVGVGSAAVYGVVGFGITAASLVGSTLLAEQVVGKNVEEVVSATEAF